MNKINVVGLMLKWARESARIPVEDVSKKFHKSPEVIKMWENESDFPTYAQLEELARIYKRPIAIFFFPVPPEEADLKKSFRTLPDFELDKLETSTIFKIRKAKIKQYNLKELCDDQNPAKHFILKEFRIDINDEIKEISKNIRAYLKVSLEKQYSWNDASEAFRFWRNILNDFGIFIFKDSIDQPEISGFCLFDQEFPVIYVNSSQSPQRQIFTLFHELGHLLTGIGGIDTRNDDSFLKILSKSDWRIEYLCNQLTGSVLVPDEDFDKKLGNHPINEDQIKKLSDLYCVSREVILRKIRDRGKISEIDFNDLLLKWHQEAREKIARMKEKSGGPNYYIKVASNLGENYISLVFNKYYQEQINIIGVAEYLDIKPKNVSKFEDKIIYKIK